MEALQVVRKKHHGKYQSPNHPDGLTGDEYVMVVRRNKKIDGPYRAHSIMWHHQGTASDPMEYWVVIRPETIRSIRDLLSASWVSTSYLAVTKSNEPTTPHGHYTEDKQGNRKHHDAVKFSIPGAVMRVTECRATMLNMEAAAIMKLLTREVGHTYFQHWEDRKGMKSEHIDLLFDRVFGRYTECLMGDA